VNIDDRSVSGWASQVAPQAWMVVCAVMSSYDRIYVGATSAPERRLARHDAGPARWSKMVLLFKTSSLAAAASVEKTLIAKARASNFRLDPDNVAPGGEGLPLGKPTYWVYALVARKAT